MWFTSFKKIVMEIKTAGRISDEIIGLYEQYGDEDYIGEPVSQLEHMVQAAELAEAKGYDEEVVLAAFFHDIGHLVAMQDTYASMNGLGAVSHEKIGSDYLRHKGFSDKIAQLVESHVQAKRYLTCKYPEYYNQLSEASKKTLEYQGGKMTVEEAAVFETDPLFDLKIQMRKWDEEAKETNRMMNNWRKYGEMMKKHLLSTSNP
jgi:phosphonate degradation associated HDIG domain protein